MTKNVSGRYAREDVVVYVQQADDTVGLMDVWVFVKRRIWFVASIVFACTLLAAIASITVSKTYTASSAVVLERKDIRPFATDASSQSLDRDRSAAETELDVLQSRQFAGRVVDQLNLTENPIFISTARGTASVVTKTFRYFTRFLQDFSVTPSNRKIKRDRAITTLLENFKVNRKGDSLAVEIRVSSQNAELAATIANTIATLYVESSLEFKQEERIEDKNRALSTRGAVGFLRQSIAQPLLVTLRAEEARLQQVRDELATKYGKNHPQIITSESQIASIRAMIDAEVKRIISDLEAESLKPSARVLSSAEVPTSPSFPIPGIIIPAAFVGSTLLAFLLAILFEAMDTRVRSGRRTSRLLQIPNLGYVPKMPKNLLMSNAKLRSPHIVGRNSNFTEAERSIYMASRFSDVSKANGVVMITSCIDSGASASMAWGVAASAAADGRNTMFIDLDFDKHITMDMSEPEARPNLIEHYFKEKTSLGEVIQKIPNAPKLGFIDATRALREASSSLNSEKLPQLFAAIKKIGYDYIVLHAPPVLAAGDAEWLSPFVDGVILSASWGKTTEEQLLHAASRLRMNRAPLIGTVIDEVDPVVHANHG